MDITTLSLIELKALVYDQLLLLKQVQTNLNVVETQINKLQEDDNGSKQSN